MTSDQSPRPVYLWMGLVISLLLPLLIVFVVHPWLGSFGLNDYGEKTTALGLMWAVLLLLALHIRWQEKRGAASVGLVRITLRQVAIAVGLGILFSLLIPVIYTVLPLIFGEMSSGLDETAAYPFPLLFFGILTAAVTEELLFRAYPLERVQELGGSRWVAGGISVAFFCLLHLPSWDLYHVFGVVLPLGIILTLVYLRTRNLLFTMIIHFMIDLPLLFLEGAG